MWYSAHMSTETFDETPQPIPGIRDRSTPHSPNRRPRAKASEMANYNANLAKASYLNILRMTGDHDVACQRVNRSPDTVYRWQLRDPAFRESVRILDDNFREMRAGKIIALEDKAIVVLSDALENKDEPALQVRTAEKVLKSGGLLVEQTAPREENGAEGYVYVREVIIEKAATVKVDEEVIDAPALEVGHDDSNPDA
jgi:hypothetical protein